MLQVGNSPLHIACEVNNCTLVRDLLDAMHMRRQCSPYLVNHVREWLFLIAVTVKNLSNGYIMSYRREETHHFMLQVRKGIQT